MKKLIEIRVAWVLFAVLAVADVWGLTLTGIGIKLVPCLLVVGAAILLYLVSQVYTKIRPEPRLAGLAITGAQLLVYTALAGILSYLVTTDGRQLIDPALVSADHSLGLDWPAMYAWSKAHTFIRLVLFAAYFSLIPQLLFLLVFVFTKNRFDRGRELFWLFALTSLMCILVSAFYPAAGAFVTFDVQTNTPYVQHFLALRGGSMKSIDLREMQGVIQFPSFHLALAVILAYAARGFRVLFPFLLALNALVVAATPLIGGHHFADLWGGAVVTLLAILATRKLLPQRAGV